MAQSRDKRAARSKAKKARKSRNQSERLPVFIEGACEFSDDPECLDNAVWVVRAIKQELANGGGPLGHLWSRLQAEILEIIEVSKDDQSSGRHRISGDWVLLFVGYVMSQQPEMMGFWKNGAYDVFWVEAGFDLSKKPVYNTLYNRFTELEKPEIVAAIGEAADELIQNAIKHDPEIGENVGIDASGFHSRAVLHHCCIDPEQCDHAQGLMHVDIATSRTVKESRWAEGDEPPELSLRHKDSARIVAVRTGVPALDDETILQGYDKVIQIAGHWYGLHDAQAAVRSYKDSDGTTRESWIGGYDMIAVDLKYGGKLQGVISPNDRMECNLYFPLMRKLNKTIQKWPNAVTGDRGQSVRKIFRFNTRRGIASVFPWRRQKHQESREEMRFAQIDEHGVVRCPWCGSECEQLRFELRTSGATVSPTFHVRCTLGLTDECDGKVQIVHPEDIEEGWRLLLPISRLDERYHALKNAHRNMEHTFRHQRQRYRTIGNDETGKLKRFGTDVHALRCEIARLVEWFRLSVRFGWLGSERRIKQIREVIRRGHHALRNVRFARTRRGLSVPYGTQAYRLGFAPTPEVPPPLPPKT